MRVIEVLVVFLSLFVMLGGLAIPLYWGRIEPLVLNLPTYIANASNDLMNLFNLILNSLNHV